MLLASRSLCTSVHTRRAAPTLSVPRIHPTHRSRLTFVTRASGDEDSGGTELSEQFKKELQRRGMGEDSTTSTSSVPRPATPPPPFANSRGGQGQEDEMPPQLAKSRELNSEGLEGFLPRASELLKLGLSFFLAFGPFIVAVALAFGAVYGIFGANFIHGGAPSSLPQYIDPQELLNEPTVDPMIPM